MVGPTKIGTREAVAPRETVERAREVDRARRSPVDQCTPLLRPPVPGSGTSRTVTFQAYRPDRSPASRPGPAARRARSGAATPGDRPVLDPAMPGAQPVRAAMRDGTAQRAPSAAATKSTNPTVR
ncbi:hypothetical protein DKT69_27220 [Micromonospora sicca]|uniref:Uncharacterized protein n=1 Tax=Micromonospora sicca TaxID=2202420 RepID=A0A317DEP4_9ACTN|nr:hypothetical protein DKT69_27220 [Micromonospora sp. 4G51]